MTDQNTSLNSSKADGDAGAADLSRLPTGELGWAELIAMVIASDDRIERYFLEIKSEIDLNLKIDRAKVAKFILGAANRDPEQAKRRFGGHALMVLGIGDGRVVGVPPFEAKDLAASVKKWVGVDGPMWDFERIRNGLHDVIVIVVDPPTGDLWTCRADGDGLLDGAIYIRADGETRQAKGDEVRQLIERATRKLPAVDVEVMLDGQVHAVEIDEAVLTDYVTAQAEVLRAQPDQTRSVNAFAFNVNALTQDNRSREKFLDQVADWERKALESPTLGVVPLVARVRDGIRVRLRNRTRLFMRDVRVDIEFEDGVVAAEWEEPDDTLPIVLFPTTPKDWGTETWASSLDLGRIRPMVAGPLVKGTLDIKRETPAMITLHMAALRPEEEHISDNDEVVLVMISDSAPESVTARWRVTAQGINDVFEGTMEIAVTVSDWREPIRQLVHGDDDDEPGAEAD